MQQKGIISRPITKRQVSRDLLWLRPNPLIAHWVGYQQKPSSELGTSLPSNTGQNGHEMPPKAWSDLWPPWGCVNYKLTLTKGTANDCTTKAFAICLCRDWTLLLQLLTFNNPWGSSRWREALCDPGNLVGQVFRELDAFRNRFYDLHPCISSYLEKH